VRIVHEDAHVLVVDKPSGLLTSDVSDTGRDSVFDLVKNYARQKAKRRGVRVWIVHRLDKEASGLLVFAKTEEAFAWLKEDFRTKRVHRLYDAVVEGEMDAPAPRAAATTPGAHAIGQGAFGTVRSYLYEGEDGLMHSASLASQAPRTRPDSPADERTPRLAVTHYRVLASGQGRSLLRVRLESGRKNQIRVHMQSVRHAIVGDWRYGATSDPIGRVCLHACELGFTHHATGQSMRLFSPTPREFATLVGSDVREFAPEARPELGDPAHGVAPPPEDSGSPAPPSASAAASASMPTPHATAHPGSWEHVADWYDRLIDEQGSDHHERVIFPGVVRLLRPSPGMRVLDLACGQGAFCRRLRALSLSPVGVDASPSLIEAATRADREGTYLVGDARALDASALLAHAPDGFDSVTCLMALMNIEPLALATRSAASVLRRGGTLIAVILHPAFRAPGQTGWGWDQPQRGARPREGKPSRRTPGKPVHSHDAPRDVQYRRVDAYLSPSQREIVMNPGAVSSGGAPVITVTYHRPIQAYAQALGDAGLCIQALEEWPSLRTSQPGPRAQAENRARREIPMFLAFRAVKA
jgi:23S rRNA-/tRNA-specific pseudouridylate synthase/SAM-dependent methyltransferase